MLASTVVAAKAASSVPVPYSWISMIDRRGWLHSNLGDMSLLMDSLRNRLRVSVPNSPAPTNCLPSGEYVVRPLPHETVPGSRCGSHH